MNAIELNNTTWAALLSRRAALPHALLLSGPRGIGKFALARHFAESLLCERPLPDALACGECPACSWLAQGNHPDFRLLQPESLEALAKEAAEAGEAEEGGSRKKAGQQITIDQVRALDDFLHVGTHRQGVRIILIHPAEAMNRATANSLLKSLEEPIASTLFLLVSNESDRLLPTIRSRCQCISVACPAPALAGEYLRQQGIVDAERWLALAGGAPLLAVELAGLATDGEDSLLDALTGALARGASLDPLAAAAALDRVFKARKADAQLKRVVEWWQKWLLDLALAREGLPVRYFRAAETTLRQLAGGVRAEDLLALNRKALQYKAQSEQPLNSRLFFEDFFLNYAALFRSR